jgi:hypothetical protein
MTAIIAPFVMFAIAVTMASEAYAGNGFAAVVQRPTGLLILVIGIVIGAVAVSVWRRFR